MDEDERQNLIYNLSRIQSSKLPVSKWDPSVELFFRLLDTLPAGTSQCERYFSLLNFYKTDRRNKLNIERVGEMITIKTSLTVESFRQESSLYVDAWTTLGKNYGTGGKADEEESDDSTEEKKYHQIFFQSRLAAIAASQRYRKIRWST